VTAIVVGVVTLLVGATGVFAQLQDALNTVWKAEPLSTYGVWGFLKDRLLSLSMILGLGFLLLVSLVLNAGLSALGTYAAGLFPTNWTVILHVFNLLLTFGVTLTMFAMIFKFLPAVKVAWPDVWAGAGMTAVLFIVGKYLIGLYLGMTAVGSSYGAAGSFVVLLLWIYYSTQILLFGAEFTQVYATRVGHGFSASPSAAAPPRKEERMASLSPSR
jgi:membrane protein